MIAITIQQPWAWLIIHGPMRVDNRNSRTSYRGPLAIHAGKSTKWMHVCEEPWLRQLVPDLPAPAEFVFGAVIGTVDMEDCLSIDEYRKMHGHGGAPGFAKGPICHVYANPRPLDQPVVCPGKLNFWQWDGEPRETREPILYPTTIASGDHFQGEMTFEKSARIGGTFEGRISATGKLYIAHDAVCDAEIQTDELLVDGRVTGTIVARRRVQLNAEGKIVADLSSPKLSVADGASLVGRCEIGIEDAEAAGPAPLKLSGDDSAQADAPPPVDDRRWDQSASGR